MGVSDETAELVIEGLASGGRGVARQDGLVWLVDGAVPGDRVLAVARLRRPRLVEGRVLRLIEPAPVRRASPCPIQGRCGGCPWMVLPEAEQRGWKRRIVVDALERVGGLLGVSVLEPIASPRSLGYRNKVELSFGRTEDGRRVLGYHGSDPSGDLVDVERCLLQDDGANTILDLARSFFLDGPGAEARVLFDPGHPMRLVLRRSELSGSLLAAFRGPGGPFPEIEEFARIARERSPGLASIVRIVGEEGRRGGARTIAAAGEAWMEERLGGIVFRLPATSFLQVNPGAAELLCSLIADLAGPVQEVDVLELYGGVGAFSLTLARRGARAEVCETDREAVECGRRAAREHGDLPVRYVRSDVGRFLHARGGHGRPGLVIADPPRRGLGKGVAEGIAALRPGRILLVSCDPATLARDARGLVARGYAVRQVVPVDMFPQTPHVEAVMLLERRA